MDLFNRLQSTDKLRLVVQVDNNRILIAPDKLITVSELIPLIQTTYQHIFQKQVSIIKLKFQSCFLDDRLFVNDCFRDLDQLLAVLKHNNSIKEIIDLDDQQQDQAIKQQNNQMQKSIADVQTDNTDYKKQQLIVNGTQNVVTNESKEQKKPNLQINLDFKTKDQNVNQSKNPIFKDVISEKEKPQEQNIFIQPIKNSFISTENPKSQEKNSETQIKEFSRSKNRNKEKKKKNKRKHKNKIPTQFQIYEEEEFIDFNTLKKRKQSIDSESSDNSQQIKKIKFNEAFKMLESDDEPASTHLFTQFQLINFVFGKFPNFLEYLNKNSLNNSFLSNLIKMFNTLSQAYLNSYTDIKQNYLIAYWGKLNKHKSRKQIKKVLESSQHNKYPAGILISQ